MNFGSRRERPTFLPALADNFRNLISQLFVNPAISFGFKFALGDGSASAMRAGAVGNGETSCQIGDLIDQLAVRRSDVKGLDQFQARPARRRFGDLRKPSSLVVSRICSHSRCSSPGSTKGIGW